MMGRYFVIGNLWLLFALLMLLGRRVVRTQPLMVSFYGGNDALGLYPSTYACLVGAAVAAGALCLYLFWRERTARADTRNDAL